MTDRGRLVLARRAYFAHDATLAGSAADGPANWAAIATCEKAQARNRAWKAWYDRSWRLRLALKEALGKFVDGLNPYDGLADLDLERMTDGALGKVPETELNFVPDPTFRELARKARNTHLLACNR